MVKGKRLNPFEHALQRPDTYIGSIVTIDKNIHLYDDTTETMVERKIRFNPGLFSIIREIGSNCIDNKWRSETTDGSPKMTKIKIDVSEDGTFTFWNDGFAIPVELTTYDYTDHRTGESQSFTMYPAELVFWRYVSRYKF